MGRWRQADREDWREVEPCRLREIGRRETLTPGSNETPESIRPVFVRSAMVPGDTVQLWCVAQGTCDAPSRPPNMQAYSVRRMTGFSMKDVDTRSHLVMCRRAA